MEQVNTLYQYYNYCKKNNSSLLDITLKYFSQTLTKFTKVEFLGTVFSERRRIHERSATKATFILLLDYGSKVGNNIKYYKTLQCNNISKLMLSPVESTPPSSPKTEITTPTLTRSNLSINKMRPDNKVNQDIAEGINNMPFLSPCTCLYLSIRLYFGMLPILAYT